MGKRKHTQFDISAVKNTKTFQFYYNRLTELALSTFEWLNLPETVDERFLELVLNEQGYALFFEDDVLGFLTLQCTIGGKLNVYRIPVDRQAWATNGFFLNRDETNSVIIFNNLIHDNTQNMVELFAYKMYLIDTVLDINVNAQKTPILVSCDENQRLTMLNLYKEYDGNAPFIFGTKGIDVNALKVLSTNAPYLADKLQQHKTNVWNEALTYFGISNVNVNKKERMISDEVIRSQGGTIASRYSRLASRKQACQQINKMFNLNIDVRYREEFQFNSENGGGDDGEVYDRSEDDM